ncbi:hypothetical protein [Bacillus thuringiensis]|uniref:hypothetical protein n=1 Tax=Bacillus thuringiensis TaxID=1428 RepID=UPI002175F188|nr:hypothetical protein [Bacillus thuringiensis]
MNIRNEINNISTSNKCQNSDVKMKELEIDELNDRELWFFSSRVGPDGKLPTELYSKAVATKRRLERKLREQGGVPSPPGGPGSVNWTPIGPSVVANGQATPASGALWGPAVSGRINAIVVGPGGSRVYAGAANGGLWFSEDGGANWRPLDDYVSGFASGVDSDSLSVGALAVRFGASATNDDVYVGTGEPGGNLDGYFGIGIRHSSSGGTPGTWTLEATNLSGKAIYRIVIDPDNPTLVYAATTDGLYQRPTSGSPTNWTRVTSSNFTNSNGTTSDIVVAGSGNTKRYFVAFTGDQVYSSTDNGLTWTSITGISSPGRVVLATGESDPSVVYALNQDGRLYRLVGTVFQQVNGVPNALFFGNQGWYDLILAVDPSNANTVYLGGDLTLDNNQWNLSLYKGTITGSAGSYTFPFNSANDVFTNPSTGQPDSSNVPNDPTWIGRGIHADAHAIAFATNLDGSHNGSNVWIGTDGGLFQSTISAARGSFLPRNTGLAITQMTYIAQNPDTDAVLFSGSQDNGSMRTVGEQAWLELLQGDGGGIAVDPNNPYRVMRQYVRSSLSASSDGGNSWNSLNFPPITSNTPLQRTAANTEGGATSFYCPIAVSPKGSLPTLVAFGTNRLWLSNDWGGTTTSSWITLPTGTNPYIPATPSDTQDVLDGSSIIAIAFASSTRLFAATQTGIWRFDNTGGTWSRTAITTTGLPAIRIITDLAVHDSTTGSFYITLGGASVDHVWFFDGGNWHSSFPVTTLDIPAHAVIVDPSHQEIVYIGTDAGCWKGTRSLSGSTNTWTWNPFSQGLPEAAITNLAFHERTRLLRAATHGRGVWEITVDAVSGLDPDIYLRVNYADTGRLNSGARNQWVEGAQDPTNKNLSVYHWMSPDIKVRRGSLTGLPTLNSQADYLDFSSGNIGDYIDRTTNIETVDQSGSNRFFIEVHNRGLTPVPGTQVRVLLLLVDAAAGLPALPSDYATRINNGDTSNWLGSTGWRFADPSMPYRILSGTLDVRTPQVAEYSNVDLSTLNLPAGHDHVCAAVFITTTTSIDQLQTRTPSITSIDTLTMQDKHVAFRNLHLVAAGARPTPNGYIHLPQTIVIDFHNATHEEVTTDLVFDRLHFPGHFSMMLPKLTTVGSLSNSLQGWEIYNCGALETTVRTHFGIWLHRVGELIETFGEQLEQIGATLERTIIPSDIQESKIRKLATLDRSRVYIADSSSTPTLSGVRIPAGGKLTAALTLQVPKDAKLGDRFHFDVIQRSNDNIIGGSSYMIVVTEEKGSR